MIIAPVDTLDVVIREALAELRKGIASARQKNQANPATGLMADLPEFVDFEIQVITDHQSSSFLRTASDSGNNFSSGSDIATSASSESSAELESESSTGSEIGSQAEAMARVGSEVGASSQTEAKTSSQTGSETSSGSESGSTSRSQAESEASSSSEVRAQSERQSSQNTNTQTSLERDSGSQTSRKRKVDGNNRAYGALDEESGTYISSGQLALSPGLPIVQPEEACNT